MVIILFALGAMVCASIVFLAGATWAALPRLRRGQSGAVAPVAKAVPTTPEREGLTLVR